MGSFLCLWEQWPEAMLWRLHHPVFFVSSCGLQAIITALGVDRRNRVLAGLYMGRSDTQLVVRQASLHVWKIVVSNTPRTLREILPTLFGLLLGFLASTCADKRTVSLLDPKALFPQPRELDLQSLRGTHVSPT